MLFGSTRISYIFCDGKFVSRDDSASKDARRKTELVYFRPNCSFLLLYFSMSNRIYKAESFISHLLRKSRIFVFWQWLLLYYLFGDIESATNTTKTNRYVRLERARRKRWSHRVSFELKASWRSNELISFWACVTHRHYYARARTCRVLRTFKNTTQK